MTTLALRLRHLGIFHVLWAVAHIGHVLRKESAADPFAWLLLLACVLVIEKPTASTRLAFLAAAQIALFVSDLPVTDNHMYIMAFANAGIAAVAVPLWLRKAPWTQRAIDALSAYAVLTLLIAYGAAALAKLNAGFFDPAVSCAVAMYYDAGAVVGVAPGTAPAWLERALPFLVAGTELAIPLLLAWKPTRSVGVAVVVLFHWSISLSPTATALDFTLLLFALVYLLLPLQASADVMAWYRSVQDRAVRPLLRSARTLGLDTFATSLPVLLLFFVLVALRWRLGTVAGNGSWALLVIAALLLGSLLLILAGRSVVRRQRSVIAASSLQPLGYVLLALLALNAATPYLGVKTVGTFTMYSNLDTYALQSNHLLFPRLPVRGYHDDLVEIVSTSNRRLDDLRERERQITWHELRRVLASDPDARITFIRGGRLYAYDRADQHPELVTVHPLWHRLVGHRAHDVTGQACLW